MATRKLITQRDEEIRRIYHHMKNILHIQSRHIMETISANYFIDKDRIYAIIAVEPTKAALKNPSIIYKTLMKNGN